jgi:hypothetical protein
MLKGSDLTASGHFHQVTKFDVSIVPFWVEIEGLVNASLACKCMSIITIFIKQENLPSQVKQIHNNAPPTMLIRRPSPLGETKCNRQVKGHTSWFLIGFIGSWADFSPELREI